MKLGVALGWLSDYSWNILEDLFAHGLEPRFIVFSLHIPAPRLPRLCPMQNAVSRLRDVRSLVAKYGPRRLAMEALFASRLRELRKRGIKLYFTRGINTDKALNIFCRQAPFIAPAINCGILGRRLLTYFPNTFVNVHAGKFPGYRGMNNVEWTLFDKEKLHGTVHFIDPGIDTGDIILDQPLGIDDDVKRLQSIDEVRSAAFDAVWKLLPGALQLAMQPGFEPSPQGDLGKVRYEMHPFLKRTLRPS